MKQCLKCKRDFEPNRWWQDFCKTQCRQEWHRARYRAQRVETELAVRDVMRARVTDEQKQKIVGPLSLVELAKQREHRRRINGHQTPAAAREKASEVLARIAKLIPEQPKMKRRI